MSEGPKGFTPKVIEGGISPERVALKLVYKQLHKITNGALIDSAELSPDTVGQFIDLNNHDLVARAKAAINTVKSNEYSDSIEQMNNLAALKYVIESRLAT